ncbi:putative transporter [Crateriforma conspicua]|uniref:Aspartate/alanine antiporter n=1 Tax=Crateriforma conspicua TaxID=2527996 RepID=A0A5C5Y3M1_9PLAN|nr:putative transporter [Crateriforma conspicua]QDV64967.1 Aspartate/alanine antiporter [Crateriforma conspicua]TWT70366.1 Aspartate/alanine antiporter [Crateriforma conspicua]
MSSIATAILILSFVAMIGICIGGITFRGIGIGSAGVLFAGIVVGHFGGTIDHDIAHFVKEFGLVLFVFTIGLQLGPGIIQLWRDQGLILNAMALCIVVLGASLVIAFHYMLDLIPLAAPGLFSGATTNTPSLGAAQGAANSLIEQNGIEGADVGTLASAYAVAYPGGIAGIIASMLILRRVFKVKVDDEVQQMDAENSSKTQAIHRRCIEVDNQRLSSMPFGEIPGVEETGVRISRIRPSDRDEVLVANDETRLNPGDIVSVVGTENDLNRFEPLIGHAVDVDLTQQESDVRFRKVFVTEPSVINQSLRDLSLDHLYAVSVTRIRRGGVEMTARGSTRFHYGDIAHLVGDEEAVDRVSKLLGNSVKAINETQFAPVFLGIAVGVLLGMIPIQIPGLPFPVKLGLAGGPLIAAISFSLIGRLGGLVWYIPYSANLSLRELGIILFLASAGLSAGETFFSIALTASGLKWMLAGIFVTMLPLLCVGAFARKLLKINYLTICGVFAGSMTDPPALAFASSQADHDACATAYAAVYPLTMVLRIVAAQSLVYLLI